MFKWLTTTKKGYTLVELMIVLVLLSLGAFALINLFRVGYRAFSKGEERYIKQEEVKNVAERLQRGTTNVAASKTADIFKTDIASDENIVPPTADNSFSYLYLKKDTTGKGGYYLYCLNRGMQPTAEQRLSNVPLYISIDAMQLPDPATTGKTPDKIVYKNQCGVIITIAALENDFDYATGTPTPDDIYYSLDVAYHFPNMILDNKQSRVVSRDYDGTIPETNLYKKNGSIKGVTAAVDKEGTALRCYSDAIITGDGADSNAGAPSFCFIATASYGHGSGEVGMLCDFRDKCLLTNPLGTAFVKAYYAISPPIADFIAENETLKAAVRVMLKPLIIGAEYALNPELRAEGAICLIAGLACLSGATITLITVDKRRRKEKRKASK